MNFDILLNSIIGKVRMHIELRDHVPTLCLAVLECQVRRKKKIGEGII